MFPYGSLQVCEPIPVFYLLYSWPQAVSFSWLGMGFLMLSIVVLIKAILFCFIGRINPFIGIPAMIAGNIASTVPGVLLAMTLFMVPMALNSGIFGWVILIVFGACFYYSTKKMAKIFVERLSSEYWRNLNPGLFTRLSLILGFVSVFMGIMIRTPEFDSSSQVFYYWAIKYGSLFFGLLVGTSKNSPHWM